MEKPLQTPALPRPELLPGRARHVSADVPRQEAGADLGRLPDSLPGAVWEPLTPGEWSTLHRASRSFVS